MDAHLRAGIAIYNTGEYHAAHDAWEAHWLDLDSGADDEQFLHGLIQFTATVYHASNGNWSGATGLADSAGEYLAGLPSRYRGVNLTDLRAELATLAEDPEAVERRQPLALTHEGRELELGDLRFEATAVAADVFAEEYGYDEQLVKTAVNYAREDLSDDVASSPFVTLLFDFVREPENRGIIIQRLGEHTDRRQSRDDDVSGLFDER
ncbi:MAG: hypothetical protein J07HX64_01597 [halophilic archaeon J07HX64]|jgi:Uncharacterized conserved protein|nr:MAG: hypothetical protein J07HX64_01597 [halophilic archaeon J07HX64]